MSETYVATCYFPWEGHRSSHEYHVLALKVLGGYIGQRTKAWENIKIDLKNMGVHRKIEPLFSVLEIGWEAISAKCQTIFLDLVLLHIEDVCNLVRNHLWHFEAWPGNNGQERNSGSQYVQICKWVHFIIHLFHWHVCAQGEATPSYYITICPVKNFV